MTLFETKLCALLQKCQELLKPTPITSEKWCIVSDSQIQTKTYVNKQQTLQMAYFTAVKDIRSLSEYSEAEDVYSRDDVFGKAMSSAGHWAAFHHFLGVAIRRSSAVTGNRVEVDFSQAAEYSRKFRKTLSQKLIEFDASARIFGVVLSKKSFSLPDGVTLHRLTRQERNLRMPTIDRFYSPASIDPMALATNKCEIRAKIKILVDHDRETAHFKAANEALRLTKELFSSMVDAMQVRLKI